MGGAQFKERLGVRENERVFMTLPLSSSPYFLPNPSQNAQVFEHPHKMSRRGQETGAVVLSGEQGERQRRDRGGGL